VKYVKKFHILISEKDQNRKWKISPRSPRSRMFVIRISWVCIHQMFDLHHLYRTTIMLHRNFIFFM